MRIKIGDQWFEATPEQPIMVEVSPQDKKNIANMLPECTKYAIFDDAEKTTREQKFAWMDDKDGFGYEIL